MKFYFAQILSVFLIVSPASAEDIADIKTSLMASVEHLNFSTWEDVLFKENGEILRRYARAAPVADITIEQIPLGYFVGEAETIIPDKVVSSRFDANNCATAETSFTFTYTHTESDETSVTTTTTKSTSTGSQATYSNGATTTLPQTTISMLLGGSDRTTFNKEISSETDWTGNASIQAEVDLGGVLGKLLGGPEITGSLGGSYSNGQTQLEGVENTASGNYQFAIQQDSGTYAISSNFGGTSSSSTTVALSDSRSERSATSESFESTISYSLTPETVFSARAVLQETITRRKIYILSVFDGEIVRSVTPSDFFRIGTAIEDGRMEYDQTQLAKVVKGITPSQKAYIRDFVDVRDRLFFTEVLIESRETRTFVETEDKPCE